MNQETNTGTRQKVDVKAIVERANAKKEALKNGTKKVQSMSEDYRRIPAPFSSYEINSKDVIRGVENQMTQSIKKGTTKYYLKNDSGERKLISLEDIKKMLPQQQASASPQKPKKDKAVKERREPKTPIRTIDSLSVKDRAEVKSILELDASNYVKSWKLHKSGYTNDEIATYTGVKKQSVSRDLWLVNEGHRPMPQ